jgi:putative ABC transport system permease protein
LGLKKEQGDKTVPSAITSAAMGPDIVSEIPGVKDYLLYKSIGKFPLKKNEDSYNEFYLTFAGESFFDIFSFELLEGNPEKVLKAPGSVVITRQMAESMFQEKDPLGQTLYIRGETPLTVTGIVEEPPNNSQFRFDAIISMATYKQMSEFCMGWKCNFSFHTYLLFEPHASKGQIHFKLNDLFNDKVNSKSHWKYYPILEPLGDIYLKSDLQFSYTRTGSLEDVYIFSAIAFFILLIAAINFINLSTALSLKRIREVGIRKITGATKARIITQFMSESVLMSLVAMIGALMLMEALLPYFNNLFNTELTLYHPSHRTVIWLIPLLPLAIGLLAGSYPALNISRYMPLQIIQKALGPHKKSGLSLRNGLVLIQFVISIVLIIASTVVYSQNRYMLTKDPGYERENLMAVLLANRSSMENNILLRDRFLKHSAIQNASVASAYPKTGITSNGYQPQGREEYVNIHQVSVDHHYLETVGIQLVKGRNFYPDNPGDSSYVLINETLAGQLNWSEPLGKTLTRGGTRYNIIGVVRDFHYESLRDPITPLIFTLRPDKLYILVRLAGNRYHEALEYMKSQWKEITGSPSMTHMMVDDSYRNLYTTEARFGKVMLSFALLAILLACLGLFGLTAISVAQRTKEMGIRKAMGANPLRLSLLMIKQYSRWVVISNLIAWPLTWYLMSQWLRDYAYRIDLDLWYFIAAGGITLLISVLTISWLALRTARTNPVHSLRYE